MAYGTLTHGQRAAYCTAGSAESTPPLLRMVSRSGRTSYRAPSAGLVTSNPPPGGHRVGELRGWRRRATARRGSSSCPAPTRTRPPASSRFGSPRRACCPRRSGRYGRRSPARRCPARPPGRRARRRRRGRRWWRWSAIGADVVSVVVSVVVLAGGGTASGVCGAGLLPRSPDTNTAASTTATPNSAIVVATSATCVVQNRDFRFCGARRRRRRQGRRVRRVARAGRVRVDRRELAGGCGLARRRGRRGAATWPAAAVAALASSPADAYRSAGCLAMPLAMTSSNARLIPRRMMLGRGGGENMCALISCRRSPASNGARPVRHS